MCGTDKPLLHLAIDQDQNSWILSNFVFLSQERISFDINFTKADFALKLIGKFLDVGFRFLAFRTPPGAHDDDDRVGMLQDIFRKRLVGSLDEGGDLGPFIIVRQCLVEPAITARDDKSKYHAPTAKAAWKNGAIK